MLDKQIVETMRQEGYVLLPDLDCDPDFTLPKGASVWIGIENLQVYVKAGDEGVSVEILPCPLTDAFEPSITETWTTWGEGAHDDHQDST